MRMASRANGVVLVLLLLLSPIALGSKLRGPTKKSLRKLNQDSLLFTEGRTFDTRKKYEGSGDNAESKPSGKTNASKSEEIGTKQKGEMGDPPATKGSTNNKGQSKKSTNKGGGKQAGEANPKSYGGDESSVDGSGDGPPSPPESSPDDDETLTQKGAKGDKKEKNGMSSADGNNPGGPKEDGNSPRVPAPIDVMPASLPSQGSYAAPATAPVRFNVNAGSERPKQAGSSIAQVAFVMSHFGLQFQFGNGVANAYGVPQTTNFAELEAAAAGYLEEYLELTYDGDPLVFFDSVQIQATSRRTGGKEGTPFIDFEANVAFMEDSPMIPTSEEISLTISEALSGNNLSTFLFTLTQRLSTQNPFLATTKVTVYVPNPSDSERVSERGKAGISGAGIAAAVGTGVVTVIVGGFVFYKIQRENANGEDNFPKGYPGGATLAGDTYDSATLGAQSLDSSFHHRTRKFTPPASRLHAPMAMHDERDEEVHKERFGDERNPRFREFPDEDRHGRPGGSEMYHDYEEKEEEDGEEFHEYEDNMEEDEGRPVQENPHAGVYSTIVGRTRAIVPSFNSAPMTNDDIKNYFKSKYKCKSPRGYEAVVPPVAAPPVDDDGGSIRGSRSLEIPALDHKAAESARQERPLKKYERLQLQESESYSDQPSDEGFPNDIYRDEDEPRRSSTAAPKPPQAARAPAGRVQDDDSKETDEEGSVDGALDDVSLELLM